MRHDRQDSSVEFLESEVWDGPDDDLVPSAGFPRLRRARLPLLVAAVVALVALVAIDVAAGPSTPSAGPPSVTTTPRPKTVRSSPAVLPPRSCPLAASCAVVFSTPTPVAEAVRHALPKVTALRTITTIAHQDAPGSRLYTRQISGHVGSARLSIDLRDASAQDPLGWNASETPVRTLVVIRVHVRGRLVLLRLVGKPGFNDNIYAMRTLAADRRLAALVP